jgi:hypothetical protein
MTACSQIARVVLTMLVLCAFRATAADPAVSPDFAKEIKPLLSKYCFDCHGDGANKGGVTLDEFKSDETSPKNRELWWKVLKNVRAGIMPPQKKPHPTDVEQQQLAQWIKYGAFGIDPSHPDPGRVTLRRLNRVEYRNTIRDLIGIDFNTTEEFPPDDTGYGFDTIADVLSVSPLLLEKYMQAAEKIVATGVPTVSRVVAATTLTGKDFRDIPANGGKPNNAERMTFYKATNVSAKFKAEQPGSYNLIAELIVRGDFDFDPGRCKFVLKIDGQDAWSEEFAWQDGKRHRYEIPQQWKAGEHQLTYELHPLTPIEKKKTAVDMQIASVRIEGPLEEKFWTAPPGYHRIFAKENPPTDDTARRQYARETLVAFATKAFRRPVDDATVDRLVKIAEAGYHQPGKNFEQGVAQAMVAVLSSPRFLFRVEASLADQPDEAVSLVDEYALASRLSYFLWSTMPDEELFSLATRGELRKNLQPQLKRLLDDPRSRAFIDNFTGQWLQARDVEGISIDARLVLARDSGQEKAMQRELDEFRARLAAQQVAQANAPTLPNGTGAGAGTTAPAKPANRPRAFAKPAVELDGPLRTAMRLEPEMLFNSIVREDRSLSELIDCDSTFLNERLAKHYGVPGVTGTEMRRVTLPKDSPRGGLLTTGSVLVVTSNPTRTSPVKRGQFILDNILGMPTPPPPADVPALEESEKGVKDHEPTVRETLQIHRDQALCRSCHARMDPLGFSLENFNAMGMWREKERGQGIDASGQLITGETFHDIRDLKKILKTSHLPDFYRCLTEKVLTYALGRGLDYYDVETVDRIVERLEKENGHFSALLSGIVESAPFQERRNKVAAEIKPVTPSEADKRLQTRVQP